MSARDTPALSATAHGITRIGPIKASGAHIGDAANEPPTTGWAPGMLQDDSRDLSRWLAGRIDSRQHATEAAAAILREQFFAKADAENTPAARDARRYMRALDDQIAAEIRSEVFNQNGGF